MITSAKKKTFSCAPLALKTSGFLIISLIDWWSGSVLLLKMFVWQNVKSKKPENGSHFGSNTTATVKL